MTAENLKTATLSPMTQGYLAVYLKALDIFSLLYDTTSMDYDERQVEALNGGAYAALDQLQGEVMKLASMRMTEHLGDLNNNTEV